MRRRKMKRSVKILNKNNISRDISESERMTIENSVLLRHIIDNDLKHLWRFIWSILILLVGLIAKSLF